MPKIDGGLRGLFEQNMRRVHWQAIETGLTGKGVPDLNGCLDGVDFWVELKQTPEWAVTLEPEQVGWILRRCRKGGRVFIAVRRKCAAGPRRPAADELWLMAGAEAREAKDGGLRAVNPLGVWTGGPSQWAWDDLLAILTGSGPAPLHPPGLHSGSPSHP